MRCPPSLLQTIHRHYDSYKAENSGSLGVRNGVWLFLGDFPWKILFSIGPLSFKSCLWQINILPTQEYLTTSWSLSSMFRALVQERNLRGIVAKSNLERFSMWRRLPHWPSSNVWLRREYTKKKRFVPIMVTESIVSAATCFLDPHPGQDFERKASRESTTKLKDLGPCTVSVIHLFSL